jgi:hypothetical protein
MPKVEINATAPEFSGSDYNGDPISLKQLIGSKNLVIVFNRGFL